MMVDKVAVQILMSFGVMESTLFEINLRKVCLDMNIAVPPIKDLFRKININLRSLSLEIKSVVLKNAQNEWIYYHGVVNNEEDTVSKDLGSYFDGLELKYFSSICSKLLYDKYLSTDDIMKLKPENWLLTAAQLTHKTDKFLSMLENEGWLRRDTANYWELGMRSYLELRTFFEQEIMADEGDKEQLRAHANELPQVIVY
eukprot:gene4994-6979_t